MKTTARQHLTLSIDGVLANWTLDMLEDMLVDKEGRTLTAEETRAELLRLQAEGVHFMPIGKPCEGFSPYTGCPGHETGELAGVSHG